MHKLLKVGLPIFIMVLFPVLAFAQQQGGGKIFELVDVFGKLIAKLIPVVIGLAVLIFLWGVLKYVVAKDEESQKEARGVMLYGIIALFVMVSVWGLVNIFRQSLNLDENIIPSPPGIPGITR